MAKFYVEQPVWQRNDAEFRAWGSMFSGALAAVGMVQTSDTGQINWSTATRAASGGTAGYEIWRMGDAMQSVFPVFIKFEYGSMSTDKIPGMRITVGSGSNGSGSITGAFVGRFEATANGSLDTSGASRPTLVSHTDGLFGFELASGAINFAGAGPVATMFISRTVDEAGIATGDGLLVVCGVSNSTTITAVAPGGVTSSPGAHIALVPTSITSGGTPDGLQAFPQYVFLPKMFRVAGSVTVHSSTVGAFTEFGATPVGSTERTYIRLGGAPGTNTLGSSSASNLVGAILWED